MPAACLLALVLWAASEAAAGRPEVFCDQYLAPPASETSAAAVPDLRWAKTLNSFDYATVDHAKFLYCCAVGATSILWYKEGRPLQTSGDDDFRPYPGRGNDTILAPKVIMNHAGNYTCEARRGQRRLVHHIGLQVDVENNYRGKPLRTAQPRDKYAEIGGSAEMFCEGFIGYGEDTKMMSAVVWVKVGERGFASREGRREITKTSRDDDQIRGAYLRFRNITDEDFGTYTCKIDNGEPESALFFNATLREGEDPGVMVKYRATYKNTLVVLAMFTAFFVATVTAVTRWRLELRLFWKDRFGKLEDDGKEYDVFVCYDADDTDFALGVLVATLEQRFNYRCFAFERDGIAGDAIMETYCNKVRASRRFLMVLSPSLACNAWCTYALYVAVNAMLNLESKIICVILQNVIWPASGDKQHDPLLQQVLRVVKKVKWENKASKRPFVVSRSNSTDEMLPGPHQIIGSPRFWTALRILLPPRRPVVAV